MNTVPLESLHFQEHRHREELAKRSMEIVALRQQVRDLGAEPVTKSGDDWLELYRYCSRVVVAASELVAQLGTSKELLEVWT
jgi:hypothetical protein